MVAPNDEATSSSCAAPVCSVLIVNIDHVMCSPTPFEPTELMEYKKNKRSTLQVPLIRIFGPIIRRDSAAQLQIMEPYQSACLYVHGAFPYLLARPVIAGPDGSIYPDVNRHSGTRHRSSTGTLSPDVDNSHLSEENEYANWDDPDAVRRMVPVLHRNLEEMLDQHGKDQVQSVGHDDNTNQSPRIRERLNPAKKVIRSISVVMGRGFYTYCPGPTAPFLRIEYYNPINRGRVKSALERGLASVPLFFHPNPEQYRGNLESSQTIHQDDNDVCPLQFHCYEAHVPYTMQFFKDWNLAGLSYVHVSECLFRRPLPLSFVQKWNEHQPPDDPLLLFLHSNTPCSLMWDLPESSNSFNRSNRTNILTTPSTPPLSQVAALEQPSQDSDCSLPPSQPSDLSPANEKLANREHGPWSRKITSCDVELDVIVDYVLNVNDVMKDLNESERFRTHWRAVPSLREIWTQERRRMSKLLDPKDDFLSYYSNESEGGKADKECPAYTLDVKKGQPVPNARSAREGMQRLVQVTPDLEDSFRKALKEIAQRYRKDVSDANDELHIQCTKEKRGKDSAPFLLPIPSPTDEDFLQALEKLPNIDFKNTGSVQQRTQHSLESSSAQSQSSHDAQRRIAPTAKSDAFQCLSHSLYSQCHFSQPDDSKVNDLEIEMSQRIDRGEPILEGPFQYVEDCIDSRTLCPYDVIDDDESYHNADDDEGEEADDAARLEKMLSLFATQTLRHQIGEREREREPSRIHKKGIDLSYDDPDNVLPAGHKFLTNKEHVEDWKTCAFDFSSSHMDFAHLNRTTSEVHIEDTGVESESVENVPTTTNPRPAFSSVNFNGAHEMFRLSSVFDVCIGVQVLKTNGIGVSLSRLAPSRRAVETWTLLNRKRDCVTKVSCASKRLKVVEEAKLINSSRQLACDNTIEEVGWCSNVNHGSESLKSKPGNTHDDTVPVFYRENGPSKPHDVHITSSQSVSKSQSDTSGVENQNMALRGIGNQGGRLIIEAGGGQLKAKTRPSQRLQPSEMIPLQGVSRSPYLATPVTLMSVEVHVQCRLGRNESKPIAMTPSPNRDGIFAIVYIFGRDPGGGDPLQVLERGCLFVPILKELIVVPQVHDDNLPVDQKDSQHHATTGIAINRVDKLKKALSVALPTEVMGYSARSCVECFTDERGLLLRLGSIVRIKDPDIMFSWDSQCSGLGYLVERGMALGKGREIDLTRLLGRTPSQDMGIQKNMEIVDQAVKESEIDNERNWKGSGLGADWDDRVGAGAAAASIVGRLSLATWKLVSEEVKHPNVSFLPAVTSSILGVRIPFHDNQKLTEWYGCKNGRERWRVIHYLFIRAATCLRLFDALDLIGRSGEAARLSGVEFSQSFPGIRGSQYKVEGVLLRALQSLNSEDRGSKRGWKEARPQSMMSSLSSESKSQSQSPWKVRRDANRTKHKEGEYSKHADDRYFFYSPSLLDTNNQEALEVQALTMEPASGHYEDPVVVCDFTALYPSLVIAYNLCYSTIFGRLEYHSTRSEMNISARTTGKIGPLQYPESKTSTLLNLHMKSLNGGMDRVYASPTGTIYVAESVLKGVLPQVLDEMLSTRAMLKKAAKRYKSFVPDLSPAILRQIEARQLALKYVANVTYGYTSATFSGRCAMPLLADTIVETGRRTLSNAFRLANAWGREVNGKWRGARVIYGDTDSVFVVLPGRTLQEAFAFGEEFCKAVTDSNPPPIALKLEKVYMGSIMQTKKKYCGMKYESRDQKKPVFEAKGIETVRRDQCALTQKILRNSLVTLFMRGPEAMKAYLFRQWSTILAGKLSVSDFVLTGRVRSRYRNDAPGPVQAALAKRMQESDPGFVVLHGARLPYVIVASPGKTTLRELVMSPMELLEQWESYTINIKYYITKHVNPALQRCLGLPPHHISVENWYTECHKPRLRIHFWPMRRSGNTNAITSYFGSLLCCLCGRKSSSAWGVKAAVCTHCQSNLPRAIHTTQRRRNAAESNALALAKQCSACNLCFEDASTFAEEVPSVALGRSRGGGGGGGVLTPLANCTNMDCPVTYERHRVREELLEVAALCRTLNID